MILYEGEVSTYTLPSSSTVVVTIRSTKRKAIALTPSDSRLLSMPMIVPPACCFWPFLSVEFQQFFWHCSWHCAFVLQLLLEQREKNLLSRWLKPKSPTPFCNHYWIRKSSHESTRQMYWTITSIQENLYNPQSNFFLHPTKLDSKIIIASKCLLRGT